MSFYTSPNDDAKYDIHFKPLTLGPSYVPLYLSKKIPSEYIMKRLINSLKCVLDSNLTAHKERQKLIKAYAEIEHMLRKKYPQDFWDAKNTHDLAVCLLVKENWKLPLCDFLNYQN
uniref:Uncharacterized protein n=1 Tax=viral metagenome TaxID=1070528 RepID=A0A6C0DXM0_9ZZZZ